MINYKQTTLSNGITLLTCPLETTEALTIQVLIGTGARFDPLAKSGVSHFLEHMFFKGSTKYPSFTEIGEILDGIGAGYNASTSYEAIKFYIQTCNEDFLKGYDVLVDILKNPLFKEEDIERERGVILEELKMYKDMPQAWVGILNQEQTFPDHPLGKDIGGSEETVLAITKEDLVKNWQDHYSADTIMIAVVGNFRGFDIETMIERDFGTIPSKEVQQFEKFEPSKFTPSLVQDVRKVDQANFVTSFPAIKKSDERRFSQNVMDIVLGCGPSSRLFTEIREKRGLAYDVGSGINSYFDTGAYYIYGGVKSDNMEEVYKVIIEELDKVKKGGFTEEELTRAKGNLRGTITRNLEGSFKIADYLTGSLYWHGKILPIDELFAKYEAVTNEEIIALANEIFDEKRAITSIVGPKKYEIT